MSRNTLYVQNDLHPPKIFWSVQGENCSERRIKVTSSLNLISEEKLEFQSKYQELICDMLDPSEIVKVTEDLEGEKKLMDQRQAQELSDFDKQIILKLDQQLKDQQSTLERAGVPGMHVTDEKTNIRVQMHLIKCIAHLGQNT